MTVTTVTSENAEAFYASRLPQREEAPQADETTPEAKDEGNKPENKEPEKKVKPIQPRINELVGERNAAREAAEAKALENAELRARLEETERQLAILNTPAQQKEAHPRPQRAQFASDEQYTDALTDWKVDERLALKAREEAEARHAAAQAQVSQNWKARVEAEAEEMPDFEAVVGAAETVFPQVVLDTIVDAGPRVAYHLAKNPVEARRIAGLPQARGVREILKLEQQLASGGESASVPAPAPKPVPGAGREKSKAPEPIEPIKGAASVVGKDESEMSFEEWKAARKAGRIG